MTISRHAGARVILTLQDFWYVCGNTWLFRWNNTLCSGPGWGFHCGGCALHRLGIRPRSVWMALSAFLFLARTNVLRHAQRAVDRFVAPSHLSARIFVEQGGQADRVTVVPSVVLTTHPSQRSRAGATDRLLRFVYVGSIIPAKGLHIAVAAFNRLSDARVQFHIYGDLTADPGYAREVQQLAHHPGIEFKGPAAREQVNNILREADLLLLPSLWYESYSIIVDEAFSVGLPVMVSSHGAPAERVIPGINGLAAPPGDVAAWQQHIQRFVNDPDLRIRLRLGIQSPPLMDQHIQVMETIYAR
jgi:glycosyltransferase involved in cell wall biosynthesis